MEKQKIPKSVIILFLVALLFGAIFISFMLGRYPISPEELLKIIFSGSGGTQSIVIFNIRFPRIFMACLVGCCLSAAGAAYQGVFQNPMASPDILGASNGAAFGAALAIFCGASKSTVTFSAFFFSLLTVFTVCFISEHARGKKIMTLVLSGIMISSLFSAATSFIKLVADPSNQLPEITYWLMGSLSGTTKNDIVFVLIPMAIGIIPMLLLRWRINILTLGEDEARAMGIDAGKLRLLIILCSTLITAASISVSGMIGWVGLVIPHLARKLVGNNYKYLLPASMLFGAAFLLLVDDISRNLLAVEIPIGILTAFVGAPFFIWLITRKEEVF